MDQVCLQGVIPPVPTLKRALIPFYEGSCLRISEVVLLLVIYQDVTESGVAYIGWGADTQLRCTRESPHIYIFLEFQGGKELVGGRSEELAREPSVVKSTKR